VEVGRGKGNQSPLSAEKRVPFLVSPWPPWLLSLPRCERQLNPTLWLVSKYRAWRGGVGHAASFRLGNMFKSDLSNYDVIMVFGGESHCPTSGGMTLGTLTGLLSSVSSLMDKLQAKVLREGRMGSIVVSYRFQMPGDERLRFLVREEELTVYRLESAQTLERTARAPAKAAEVSGRPQARKNGG
jgi:hypothetical protein